MISHLRVLLKLGAKSINKKSSVFLYLSNFHDKASAKCLKRENFSTYIDTNVVDNSEMEKLIKHNKISIYRWSHLRHLTSRPLALSMSPDFRLITLSLYDENIIIEAVRAWHVLFNFLFDSHSHNFTDYQIWSHFTPVPAQSNKIKSRFHPSSSER